MRRFITTIFFTTFALLANSIYAQQEGSRVISPGASFLLTPSDALSSGMAGIGVATPVNTFSQQWNPAKYIFAKEQQGIGLSYIPYLQKLSSDISIAQINYYNRINKRNAFAASFRYNNLGEVIAAQNALDQGLTLKPNELSLDLSYALKLSETFSMAVAMRYIRSDLRLQTELEDAHPANTFGVDLSGYYQGHKIPYRNFYGRWRAGFSISNIGPKIKYSDMEEGSFLPTKLSLGGGFDFILDKENTIGAYVQLNKLLVPTPISPNYKDLNGDGQIDGSEREEAINEARAHYDNIGAIEGIFKSFGDAPDGLREELKEITWAIGAEYRFLDRFAFRAGYFHESPDKGYRQHLTLGAGFRYEMAELNISYLFSTTKNTTDPMEGSLQFSLGLNFGKVYKD